MSMDVQPRGSTLKVLLNEELLGEFATRSRQREVVEIQIMKTSRCTLKDASKMMPRTQDCTTKYGKLISFHETLKRNFKMTA